MSNQNLTTTGEAIMKFAREIVGHDAWACEIDRARRRIVIYCKTEESARCINDFGLEIDGFQLEADPVPPVEVL
jgi:hypothetical protein